MKIHIKNGKSIYTNYSSPHNNSLLIFMTFVRAELGSIERLLNE